MFGVEKLFYGSTIFYTINMLNN